MDVSVPMRRIEYVYPVNSFYTADHPIHGQPESRGQLHLL